MGYRVAVVGATGNVGQKMVDVLLAREFPVDTLVPMGSHRSRGQEIEFGERQFTCAPVDQSKFDDVDIALFAIGSEATKEHAPRAAAAGCVVIDNSSLYRYCDDVPLIVPEVNPQAVHGYDQRNIIANPNCSTAQLVVALKPLHDRAKIRRIVVSTYQSVSGAGKAAMEELRSQQRALFSTGDAEPEVFPKRIAANVIPQIDNFQDSGETREEWKMQAETARILDPSIRLTATCVRVPVFVGHAEAVNLEFEEPLSEAEARELLAAAPGVTVVDERVPGGYATPLDCAGEDATFVSRIRRDPTIENGLNLWCVSDNLLKGAALNAVQIAELLAQECLRTQE